jgi:hypothetical protein
MMLPDPKAFATRAQRRSTVSNISHLPFFHISTVYDIRSDGLSPVNVDLNGIAWLIAFAAGSAFVLLRQ